MLVNNAVGNFVVPTLELSPNGCHAAISTPEGIQIWRVDHQHHRDGHCRMAAGCPMPLRPRAAFFPDENARSGMGTQIQVNTISPGPIGDTDGVKRMYIDVGRGEQEARNTDLGRFGRKVDIANAAVYLASELADYVTGENLIVDGGRWLKQVAPSTLGAKVWRSVHAGRGRHVEAIEWGR